jgi:hypothetical protein
MQQPVEVGVAGCPPVKARMRVPFHTLDIDVRSDDLRLISGGELEEAGNEGGLGRQRPPMSYTCPFLIIAIAS